MLTRIAVAITVLGLVLPATTLAQGFVAGDKEIMLSGSGTSDHDFDSTVFSAQGSLGYFFTNNIEVSIREALGVTNVENGGSSWNSATRVAGDFHFDLGRFWPFAGANLGYTWGHNVPDSWEAGLEGGLKFFVNTTTFVFGQIEYSWFFTNHGSNDAFKNGQWFYTIGIGFTFK